MVLHRILSCSWPLNGWTRNKVMFLLSLNHVLPWGRCSCVVQGCLARLSSPLP